MTAREAVSAIQTVLGLMGLALIMISMVTDQAKRQLKNYIIRKLRARRLPRSPVEEE